MKTKLITAIATASIAVAIPLAASAAANGECGENLTWALDDNGVLTISGSGDMTDYIWDKGMPWYDYLADIKEVVIEEGVTSIGDYAFNDCVAMTKVLLPDSLEDIGEYAFRYCEALETVNIPDNVTILGRTAFQSCDALTSVTVGEGVTIIEEYTFAQCKALKSVKLSDKVTRIQNNAFYICQGLTDIELPPQLEYIGTRAFYDCPGITELNIPDTVKGFGTQAFYGCNGLNSITIPDGVKIIPEGMFELCVGLEYITLPDSITEIGDDAFSACYALKEIQIPSGVTSIGDGAFSNCWNLTSFTVPEGITTISKTMLYSCKILTEVTLPKSITHIGNSAFAWCDKLTNVYYNGSEDDWDAITNDGGNQSLLEAELFFDGIRPTPDPALDSIASGECGDDIKWALSKDGVIIVYGSGDMTDYSIRNSRSPWYDYSDSIKKIVIDSGVTSVGDYTFAYCHNVEEIIISETVENIGASAFRNCRIITELSIPVSVTEIGNGAFYSSTGLTDIYYGGSKSDWNNIAIAAFNAFNSATVHYAIEEPDYTCGEKLTWKFNNGVLTISGSGDMYDWELGNTPPWKSYNSDITQVIIEDGVTSIGDYAFSVCDAMTTVTLPKSLTSIGESAFGKCTALTDVYYNGSEEDWSKIATETDNAPLLGAAIHFTVQYKVNEILRNDGTVNVNVSKNTAENAVLIIASYNDGRLVEVKFCDISDISGDKTIDIEMDALDSNRISAFIWKSITSMEPVVEASCI